MNWKDVEISDCEISGESYTKNNAPYTFYNTVLRIKGADNLTFKKGWITRRLPK